MPGALKSETLWFSVLSFFSSFFFTLNYIYLIKSLNANTSVVSFMGIGYSQTLDGGLIALLYGLSTNHPFVFSRLPIPAFFCS